MAGTVAINLNAPPLDAASTLNVVISPAPVAGFQKIAAPVAV